MPAKRLLLAGLGAVLLVGLGSGPGLGDGEAPLPMSERGGTFADDDGNLHEGHIEAVADAGVVSGCDPPRNDRYCPRRTISRGELAAILRRAAGLPAAAHDHFVDDDASMFAGDIDAIAAAGITRGCNPPRNDRYCPDRWVTRGEAAAMVRRAFDVPSSAVDAFVDDQLSPFAADIDAIAAADITRGCNPPHNDRYCPHRYLTRDEAATLVARAAGLSPRTPPPGVTTRPDAPSALNGRLVPWDEVGPGWYLVLYSARDGMGAFQEGEASILYVVDPDGVRYEVAAWHGTRLLDGLYDWRPDGKAALVFFYDYAAPPDSELHGVRRILHVDFTSGAEQILDGPATSAYLERVTFARPDGANLVARVIDPPTERIELRTLGGTQLAVLSERPAPTGFELFAGTFWLSAPDGRTVVLGGEGGLRLVAADGTTLSTMATPSGRFCRPIRWWEPDSVLAGCHFTDPQVQHANYVELWIVPTDGAAGTALTKTPTRRVPLTDYGFEDAIATRAGVRLTRSPACSQYTVGALSSSGEWEPLETPEAGKYLVGVHDGRMAMVTWPGCDIWWSELVSSDLDGGDRRVLVPRVGNVMGVSWDALALE